MEEIKVNVLWKEIKSWFAQHEFFDQEDYDQYIKTASFKYIGDNKYILILVTRIAVEIAKNHEKDILSIINSISGTSNNELIFLEKSKYKDSNIKSRNNINDNIDNEKMFDSFILGKTNEKAFNACRQVISNPSNNFNPLFIFGDPGLGKTHLLKSIENELRKNDKYKVLYLESTEFRQKYINALTEIKSNSSNQEITNLKNQILDNDFFLIDDFQLITKSDKTNEFFFEIFNSYISLNKQLVVVSDKIPELLTGFDKRLISRLNSGLSVKIDSPDFETSVKYLKNKAVISNLKLSDEAINFIASYYSSDMRKLEGIIRKIYFWTIQDGQFDLIKLDYIENLLKEYTVMPVGKINMHSIKEYVANAYGTTVKSIDSKIRYTPVMTARHIAMYLSYEILNENYTTIGESFGGKNHTTVMHAIKKVEEMKKNDPKIKKFLNTSKKQLTKN